MRGKGCEGGGVCEGRGVRGVRGKGCEGEGV